MASSIAGPKGSTSSKRPPRDKFGPSRDVRVVQTLAMQGLLAAALLLMAWLSRAEPKRMGLYLLTLVIPAAWSLVAWRSHKAIEAARQDGSWSAAWEKAQTKKAMGALGAVFFLWVVAAALVAFYA